MDLGLKAKVVLVTGGARGIGAAIVRGCVAEGAVPIIVDRDRPAVESLASELHTQGMEARVIVADLSLPAECERAVAEALKSAGRLDALVNNAGRNDKVGLERGTVAEFESSLRRNLIHYFVMAHSALVSLRESKGTIINIASKVALTGQGGTSGYAAAKGAILGLTREWAAELFPLGIRVNAVVPAEVMTPLYRQWLDTFPDPRAKQASIVSKIPLGKRMTTAEEIASMVLFLLSGRASHITGQFVFVDGGYVHLDRALT